MTRPLSTLLLVEAVAVVPMLKLVVLVVLEDSVKELLA
jgi:hypothetical protein